jgi:hypothetical protein
VYAGHGEIRIGVAPAAALDADDLETGIGQLFREDGAGEADPDGDDVDGFEFGSHYCSPVPVIPRPEAEGALFAQRPLGDPSLRSG